MNKQPTTEQLRKYVAGQLSRAEQYAVERAALDDPFVADALDGLMVSKNAKNDLTELQTRLQKRVNPKETQRLGVWLWASAAALVLSVGLGWIYLKQDPTTPPTMSMTKPEIEENAVPTELIKPKKDEMVAAVEVPKPKKEIASVNAPMADEVIAPAEQNLAKIETKENTEKDEAPSPAPAPSMMKAAQVAKVDSLTLNDGGSSQITVKGIIKGTDGETLPGVSVNVKGTNRGVSTDANGAFLLDKIQMGDRLSFNYVGFDTKEITVKDTTTQQIVLKEDNKVLSEVVIGYDRKAKRAAKKAARKAKRASKNR